MWSKRLMRTVMVGMAVLSGAPSVAAQECQRPPAKVAVLWGGAPANMNVTLFCDKVKAPACAVTFLCGRNASPEDPATWDMSVPPGKMFRYRWHDAPGSFAAAIKDAGWSEKQTRMGPTVCVVRSNDPVEVYSLRNMLTGSFSFLPVSQRISPPEPYPCLSSNAALSSLTVSGGGTLSPSFDSDTTAYTFTTRATTVTFTPTAADSGATISVNNGAVQSGAASGSFAVPWPRLPITVTAEDGTTTRTYYVTITRSSA